MKLILLLLFAGIFSLQAQQALSLQDIWELAEKNNLVLKENMLNVSVSQNEIEVQRAAFFPTLGFSGKYMYQSELAQLELPAALPIQDIQAGVNNTYDLSLVVNQAVFTGFRTSNLVKAARSGTEVSTAQKEAARNTILLQTGTLFYAIQLNRLQQNILQQSLRRTGNQLMLVKNMVNSSQAIASDTLEISSVRLNLQNSLAKLIDGERIMLAKLRVLLNLPETPLLSAINPVQAGNYSLNLEEQQKRALVNRPEIVQLTAIKRAGEYRKNVVKSALYPQVYANAAYHYARPGVNFFKDEWMDYYTVGIQLQWDLWDNGQKKRKIESAQLEIEKTESKLEQLKLQIGSEVEEAWLNLQAAERNITLQKKLVDQEQERYRVTNEKYSRGQGTLLELNSAEADLTAAQLTLQKQYIAWFEHKLNLDFATGSMNSEIGGQNEAN